MGKHIRWYDMFDICWSWNKLDEFAQWAPYKVINQLLIPICIAHSLSVSSICSPILKDIKRAHCFSISRLYYNWYQIRLNWEGDILLIQLLDEHANVDFSPLQTPIPEGAHPSQTLSLHSRMLTAALLHYNLNMVAVITFLGGIHTSAHRQ